MKKLLEVLHIDCSISVTYNVVMSKTLVAIFLYEKKEEGSMEAIQTQLISTGVSVALAVISLGGAYAVFYIHQATQKVKAQTVQIKDQALRKQLEDALDDTEYLAGVTVGAIEQTTARQLREAVKDGKVDKEELQALAAQAFAEIKSGVSPTAQQVITNQLGDFDTYLTNLIERKVLELKTASGKQ